jgi:tetratricopeptide (TPR) repeat protein
VRGLLWVSVSVALALLAAGASGAQRSVPASAAGDFARAVTLFEEHDDTGEALAEAEQLFAKILAYQPRHAPARAYQGLIAIERGQMTAAETAFTNALAIDGRCPEARVGRVRLLRARGEWQASYDEARLAVRLAPNSVLARWELVTVLCHRAEAPVGEQQWREAVPHLLRILSIDRTSRQAHFELAEIDRQLGRPREAIPHYQQVLRIGQTAEDSDVWVYEINRTVSECSEKIGDRARAIDYLQRYLRELRVVGASPESIAEVETTLARLRAARPVGRERAIEERRGSSRESGGLTAASAEATANVKTLVLSDMCGPPGSPPLWANRRRRSARHAVSAARPSPTSPTSARGRRRTTSSRRTPSSSRRCPTPAPCG